MRYRIRSLLVVICFAFLSNAYAQSAKELSDQAHKYYKQGNYQQAITLLQKSINMVPAAESYYGLGLCYIQTGDLAKATSAFHTAARKDKYFVKALYALAQIYSSTKYGHFNLDAAIDVLVKALAIDPNHAAAQFKLGEIYFIKGTVGTNYKQMQAYQKQAETALRRAIKLDPQNADAHSYLGQLYGTWGKRSLAILQFQKAVKLNPKHNEAWFYLGKDYYRMGMLEQSIQALQKAQLSQYAHIRQAATNLLAKVRAARANQ